jgi:hypothetical protein
VTGQPASSQNPEGARNPGCFTQTAKHHTRRQSGNPITAVVVELFGDKRGIHADLTWMSN